MRKATYLATFVTGLEQPFRELLGVEVPESRIDAVDAGLCVFRTTAAETKLALLRGARNVFTVLAQSPGGVSGLARAIDPRDLTASSAAATRRAFWLGGWHDSQPVSPKQLVEVERAICRITGWRAGDRTAAALSVLSRRDGKAFLLRKLTTAKPKPRRGELPRDLAELLCGVSGVAPDDVFLDPFCGSGAIPRARASWPYAAIFCSDRDQEAVARMKAWLGKRSKDKSNRFNVRRDDALKLERYSPGFVTRIVTDPPWGQFASVDDLPSFYTAMLTEHARIVHPSRGALVYLIGAKLEFERALARVSALEAVHRFEVLVSGQKATVFDLRPVERPGT